MNFDSFNRCFFRGLLISRFVKRNNLEYIKYSENIHGDPSTLTVAGFINQTFSSSKYYRDILASRHVNFPPGKYTKSISRTAHCIIAFKNPRDQLGMNN